MTHTLHRQQPSFSTRCKDYAVINIAAQGINAKGAKEKLKKIFKILLNSNPVNASNDSIGGILSGFDTDYILSKFEDNSTVEGAFSSREALVSFLKKLKKEKLGISAVVTGNIKEVFASVHEVGLQPHTVHMSLGIFGNKKLLPSKNILSITTMCGHGMISTDYAEDIIRRIRKGVISSQEGALEMAKFCTCGVFNVVKAIEILDEICNDNN